jgi:mannose-6-phosphate isomerase-like protein (cupin superfamily)
MLNSEVFLPFSPIQNRDYGTIRLFAPPNFEPFPFRYSIFTVSPYASTTPDQHEVFETWVVLDGRGDLILGGEEKFEIESGDVVQIRSMQIHQVRNLQAGELKIFSFWWKHAETVI